MSLKPWLCFEVHGRIPTVVNDSANTASVAAGGAGACL